MQTGPSRPSQDAVFASLSDEVARGRLTRAELVGRAAALGLSASAIGALVAACGGGSGGGGGGGAAVETTATAGSSTAAASEIKRGGRLRVADRTGGTGDTLDPIKYGTALDGMRIKTLYDTLARYDNHFVPQPRLASEWEASADNKTWTIRLVPGATWHDGRDVTADDVVTTFKRLVDPKVGATIGSALTFMKGAEIKAMDKGTVRFALQQAYVDFPAVLALDGSQILPSDYDPKKANTAPIGSGPFKFVSFTPGKESLFARNENYWRDGYPFVDELQLLDITDENARNNALLSGQIDVSTGINFTSIKTLESRGAQIFDIPGGTFNDITLVQDAKPLSDRRIREAFSYAIDRDEIIQIVYLGKARVGNDQPISEAYPFAPTTIPQRSKDPERAKKLLADAGYPNGIDLQLLTADGGFGMIDLAVTAATQAKDSGFNIEVKKWPADSYWNEVWLKKNFYISWWTGRSTPDLLISSTLVSDAQWNEPHFRSPEFDAVVAQARGVADTDQRTELYTKALTMVHDSSSWVIPAFMDLVHAGSSKFNFEELPPPNSNVDFVNGWLSS